MYNIDQVVSYLEKDLVVVAKLLKGNKNRMCNHYILKNMEDDSLYYVNEDDLKDNN